jgi:hypothetical protein
VTVGRDAGSVDDVVMVPMGTGKERSDVNSLSHLYVAARQNEMRNDAANERLAKLASSTDAKTRLNASWLASTAGGSLKSVWSLLSGPADRPGGIPTLTDYPYRG